MLEAILLLSLGFTILQFVPDIYDSLRYILVYKHELVSIDKRIGELKANMRELNQVSTFVEYSKLQRKLNELEKQKKEIIDDVCLGSDVQVQAQKGFLRSSSYKNTIRMIQLISLLSLLYVYEWKPALLFDCKLIWPFGMLLRQRDPWWKVFKRWISSVPPPDYLQDGFCSLSEYKNEPVCFTQCSLSALFWYSVCSTVLSFLFSMVADRSKKLA